MREARLFNKTPTQTHFDKLPADVIDYLCGFTIERQKVLFNIKERYVWGHYSIQRQFQEIKAWEDYDMSEKRKRKISMEYRCGMHELQIGEMIFLNGKHYLLLPVNKVYKRRKPKFKPELSVSVRCKGKTGVKKRCKTRTRRESGFCSKHNKI